ncbi:hypothetical protein [Anabaena azotica]|uniref:Uncharacterized protein n=1 Tax=Anabaena azotica FACHB-119 TaxID=947527 RepID=A0ABR8D6E0_9NOST|nr:hypothetical protein [Anabaena azotica]MBD2501890.1 hypothetical protein [Anabaena azotica FACHB-119]
MDLQELEHHYRVIDMMLSMHSKLRDDNQNLALTVNLVLLVSSVILCTFVFIDPELLKFLKINTQISQITIGLCSNIAFVISLIEFRVDWKQKAERHGQACEILGKLKAECRGILKSNTTVDPQIVAEQCRSCAQILNTLPKIPDNKFPSLKAYHKTKIELSKIIDLHPGIPVWILRITLIYHSFKKLFSRQNP